MNMALPPPLKPWMRKRIREAAKADSEAEVLKALTEVSRSHSVFVETEFAICDETVTVLQRDRKIAFPRPLQRENHRTILIGYLECMASKYQLEDWCEVAPGDVVIDCGAYVGGFARSVVEKAGRTVVIEPAPANYECCMSNLDGFSNAETYQIGLFDKTGILPLQMSRSSVDHSLLSPDRGATGTTLDVETLRLDDLAARLSLERIDFFKLEAEGAEIEVIDGMGDLRPGKIAIDAGPERYGKSPMAELAEMLGSRGYETRSRGNVLHASTGLVPESGTDMPYDYRPFPYVAPPGLSAEEPRHRVAVVGAGPIGLAMALELANHEIPSVILDDNNVVSVGSRAICWSKRSLEILDRLGVGDRCVEKGVTWKFGRTFHRNEEVFGFDLLPESGHKMPAFVNLQQYYVEQFLVEAAQRTPLIDLRFKNRVINVERFGDHAILEIETPDGEYSLEAEYVLACDGAKSPIRQMMGLDFEGELFEERFLIADIEMKADFPPERWFWFEPPFHQGQSALLHKQPDNIWRIDLQLGWDADPEEEKRPENVIPRIENVVGHRDFRLDWVSVYTFQCRRLAKFVHSRVIFVGDSAHVVSPFGARGGNGGLQDVDSLGWKLAAVLNDEAPSELLDAYDRERVFGADENLRHSTRATKFLSPDDGVERLFRDCVLALAAKAEFARSWVNSGRLSRPCIYPTSAPDDPSLPHVSQPGAVAPDAPVGKGWLLNALGGDFKSLVLGTAAPDITGLTAVRPTVTAEIRERYLGDARSAVYLIRPDQVVGARWLSPSANEVKAELKSIMEGRR